MAVSVEIEISRIAVEGLGALDGARVRAHLERELGRAVADRGVPDAWLAGRGVPRADVALQWDGRDGERGLAAALARRIVEGVA